MNSSFRIKPWRAFFYSSILRSMRKICSLTTWESTVIGLRSSSSFLDPAKPSMRLQVSPTELVSFIKFFIFWDSVWLMMILLIFPWSRESERKQCYGLTTSHVPFSSFFPLCYLIFFSLSLSFSEVEPASYVFRALASKLRFQGSSQQVTFSEL